MDWASKWLEKSPSRWVVLQKPPNRTHSLPKFAKNRQYLIRRRNIIISAANFPAVSRSAVTHLATSRSVVAYSEILLSAIELSRYDNQRSLNQQQSNQQSAIRHLHDGFAEDSSHITQAFHQLSKLRWRKLLRTIRKRNWRIGVHFNHDGISTCRNGCI